MTVRLVHGINAFNGGRNTVGRLADYLSGLVQLFSYGWTGPLSIAWKNPKAIDELVALIEPGDVLVAHSNGCLIAWEVAERCGDKLGAVVTINAALRRDTDWHPLVPVLNLHNTTDWTVKYFARWWARLFQPDGVKGAGWGAGGYYGFTNGQNTVDNWNTSDWWWEVPVTGHSGVFTDEAAPYWGGIVNAWIEAKQKEYDHEMWQEERRQGPR